MAEDNEFFEDKFLKAKAQRFPIIILAILSVLLAACNLKSESTPVLVVLSPTPEETLLPPSETATLSVAEMTVTPTYPPTDTSLGILPTYTPTATPPVNFPTATYASQTVPLPAASVAELPE